MAGISRFIRDNTVFDPETLKVLRAAYDLAVACLHDTAQQPDPVYEVIAARIIAAAKKGQRDPRVLCREALRGAAPGCCP